MKRALAVFVTILATLTACAAPAAKGKFVVSGKTRQLKHAYVFEEDRVYRIVLTTDEVEGTSDEALQESVGNGVSALVIQLDDRRNAQMTYFYDPDLPPGLTVAEYGKFSPQESKKKGTLAGRAWMQSSDFSFSYDATFEAPVVVQEREVAKIDPANGPGFRAAVMNGDVDAVKQYLDAGTPVDSSDALRLAVEQGKSEVVKLLLARGANKDAKDAYGQSVVMSAASMHQADALSQLIAAGADINAPNDYRLTPLAVAAEQGHLDLIHMLINAGANVNARDTAGGTALSVAILRGYREIVAALLEAKADVKRDQEDLLALAEDKPEIKAMLERAIAQQ